MDEQRMQAYVGLVEQLLGCPQGKEAEILQANADLVDTGLLMVMGQYAKQLERLGNRNAGHLRQLVQMLEGMLLESTIRNYNAEIIHESQEEVWNWSYPPSPHPPPPPPLPCASMEEYDASPIELPRSIGRGTPKNDQVKNDVEENDASPIYCYVHAEMENHVIIQRVTTVEVILSNEIIDFVNSATSRNGKIQIDALKKLIVQVIPKVNFESIGEARVEIESLSLDTPHHIYFDLRPTDLGEGEVWVVFRQSQLPLLTLTLKPKIVASRRNLQRLSSNGSIHNIPQLSEPLHQLRIIERRNGAQITYDYELDSPVLNILGRYESKPIASDRQQYIETLYREIESRWYSAQEDVDAFAAELRAFGGQLLDELFPEPLQRQLWEHRHSIQSIMVLSTEPFIPWELVHLKPPGQAFLPDEVCFLGQLGLVRWLYDVGFPPESITLRADRCRYVIPYYPDNRYRLPQAEQEAQFLEQTFQATAIEPQPNPVRQALESASFDLLHFAGHGEAKHGSTATANLLLEGRVEGSNYIRAFLSATTVSQYCRFQMARNQPIVLLNACQIGRTGYALTGISGFAQAFLKGGAGAFIGSLWAVGDRPARVFSESLYTALMEGSNLAEAVRIARERAQSAGDATWLAYAVYGHPYLKVTLQKVK